MNVSSWSRPVKVYVFAVTHEPRVLHVAIADPHLIKVLLPVVNGCKFFDLMTVCAIWDLDFDGFL